MGRAPALPLFSTAPSLVSEGAGAALGAAGPVRLRGWSRVGWEAASHVREKLLLMAEDGCWLGRAEGRLRAFLPLGRGRCPAHTGCENT